MNEWEWMNHDSSDSSNVCWYIFFTNNYTTSRTNKCNIASHAGMCNKRERIIIVY